MTDREVFLFVAEKFLNVPYQWGGYGPHGVDCSGLVNECEKSLGRMKENEDRTAEGIYQHYKMKGQEVTETDLRPGCLVFRIMANGIANHVEVIWRHPGLSIGASGGTSKTDTLEEAIASDARVRIRPWARLGTNLRFVDPFLGVPWTV